MEDTQFRDHVVSGLAAITSTLAAMKEENNKWFARVERVIEDHETRIQRVETAVEVSETDSADIELIGEKLQQLEEYRHKNECDMAEMRGVIRGREQVWAGIKPFIIKAGVLAGTLLITLALINARSILEIKVPFLR